MDKAPFVLGVGNGYQVGHLHAPLRTKGVSCYRRMAMETEKLLSRKQLVERKTELRGSISGIYFLLDDSEIIYVGQSTSSAINRVVYHRIANDKHFDSFVIIECDSDKLNQTEAEYIWKFAPKYNNAMPGNSFYLGRKAIQKRLGISGWVFRRITNRCTTTQRLNCYDIREIQKAIEENEK